MCIAKNTTRGGARTSGRSNIMMPNQGGSQIWSLSSSNTWCHPWQERHSSGGGRVLANMLKRPLRDMFLQSKSVDDTNHKKDLLKKWVSFAPRVSQREEVLSGFEYSDEEHPACWYSDDEMEAITPYVPNKSKKMNQGQSSSFQYKKDCSRGLEGHTITGQQTKVMARRASINAVLDEQERQSDGDRCTAGDDDNAMGIIYHQRTSSPQLWVCGVCIRDHRTAKV